MNFQEFVSQLIDGAFHDESSSNRCLCLRLLQQLIPYLPNESSEAIQFLHGLTTDIIFGLNSLTSLYFDGVVEAENLARIQLLTAICIASPKLAQIVGFQPAYDLMTAILSKLLKLLGIGT